MQESGGQVRRAWGGAEELLLESRHKQDSRQSRYTGSFQLLVGNPGSHPSNEGYVAQSIPLHHCSGQGSHQHVFWHSYGLSEISLTQLLSSLFLRFCNNVLWQRQALPPAWFPTALEEKEFVIPGGNIWTSNEARKNLTDQQELAQWLGGMSVPSKILGALLEKVPAAVVFSPTAYNGCLERAAVGLGFPCYSSSSNVASWQCAKDQVRDWLLEAHHSGSVTHLSHEANSHHSTHVS